MRGEDGGGLPVDLSRLIRGHVTSEHRHTRQGKQTSLLMSTSRGDTSQCPLVRTVGGFPAASNESGWTFDLKTETRRDFDIKYMISSYFMAHLCFILPPLLQSR